MARVLGGDVVSRLGWALAVLAFLLLVLRDVLKTWLTKATEAVGRALYQRLAGNRLLLRTAIRRYRSALVAKHAQIEVPFLPDRTLSMADVYVPLHAVEPGHEATPVDAHEALAASSRLMVIGAPGSGKSMLLRNWVYAWARGDRGRHRAGPLPILLDMHRLSDAPDAIERELVAQLARDGFPHAERFLQAALRVGFVRILLDGLDEVASQNRARVVRAVRDFMEEHRLCPVVITCRTAVYEGQFAGVVDRTLQVADLDDHLVIRFLQGWPGMKDSGSAQQLMATLRDAPRIKALARNPLLLTMIAFLYTDVYSETQEALPRTRAEFYREATDMLLRRLHNSLNRYAMPAKRSVLQSLALFSQRSAAQMQHDRLAMDYATVLSEVRRVLPSVGLDQAEALNLLDEIVERSGLLLAIDGGERYQFAHLTLQEFFAAQAQATEPDALLASFDADPTIWRETVRLWCGASGRDATDLIRRLLQVDPVLALECVADADRVDEDLAGQVIETMKSRLRSADSGDAVARAFGAVAASPRPWGRRVFEFLDGELDAAAPEVRLAAATALGATNLPRAADALAARSQRPEIRQALVRLGDLAVPRLAERARSGSVEAMDDLLAIGTATAATALAGLLWHDDAVATEAAWRLAGLIDRPDVAEAFDGFEIRPEWVGRPWLPWIWSPFERPDLPGPSAMAVLVGRVAHLLHTADGAAAPAPALAIDPRIGVPLCAVSTLGAPVRNADVVLPQHLRDLAMEALASRPTRPVTRPLGSRDVSEGISLLLASTGASHDVREALAAEVMPSMWPRPVAWLVATRLPARTRFDLVARLLAANRDVEERDWRNVLQTDEYRFGPSWHYRLLLLLTAAACVPAIVEGVFLARTHPEWGLRLLLIYAAVSTFTAAFVAFLPSKEGIAFGDAENYILIVGAAILVPLGVLAIAGDDDKENLLLGLGIGLLLLGLSPGVVILCSLLALQVLPLWAVIAGWVAVGTLGTLFWLKCERRERDAANPLRGVVLD